MSILSQLPQVRGQYREQADLAKTSWFQVGGNAEVLFKPADVSDLQDFLRTVPKQIPITVLGACSNVIIRDGGIKGVVIKLGRCFAEMVAEGETIIAGAASLDVHVATVALQHSLAGLEFLSGIPGTIGGALAMNAGAYGREIKEIFIKAEAVDRDGNLHMLSLADMGFSYRKNAAPEGLIFTRAWLRGDVGNAAEIQKRMDEIKISREATQPVRTKTGGSTFANPEGYKAWELVDKVGYRGYQLGGAKVSEKHCNFLENIGNAKAADLENLGEEIRAKVLANYGIELKWEIKRIGN